MLILSSGKGRITAMMQIVYFSQKSQLWTEWQSLAGEVQFVTPSPAKADSLRLQLGGAGINHDVLTIARFTSNLIQALWEENQRPQVKRKADLLLIFGILKNKYFPDLGYEQFMQGYNLFSDLRSFTMDENALVSVMEEQPEEIQKAVSLFWKLLSISGFLDEHGAYQQISEALRSAEESDDLKKTYIFWGFQHLNGQQVDLLKALSIRYQVIIPFPLALKEALKRSDWVSWLRENKVEERDLPSLQQQPSAEWLKVNSREIASTLKEVLQDGDQVLLGVSKLTPLHLDMVPSLKVSYKIPHQLISSELKELASQLKLELRERHSLSDLENTLKLKRDKILISLFRSYKALKALELYQEALASIRELTDEKLVVDSFFLKLLHEVVSLNQPRTSYVPMSETELTIELKDMSSLEDIDRSRRTILCIDDRFDEIQSLGQNYTESIQKALSHLGPLKRNELELMFKSWELKDLFAQGQVLVLMSESTLKHSLVWKRLFHQMILVPSDSKVIHPERKVMDHFQRMDKLSYAGHFSASKFQSFIDCPRRFYFSYVDKVFPSIALEKDFDPMLSGTVSHEIIEVFHKRGLRAEELPALTKEIMQKYISLRKLVLPRETFLKRELEFNHRSFNGIQFLVQLEQILGEKISWKMEEKFDFISDYKITGSIDCLGESERSVFLIDFKSTGSSVPSKKEILELDNLQLWAYAHAAERAIEGFEKKNIVLGFVSLDKPSDSRLMMTSEDQAAAIKGAKLCKYDSFAGNFIELFKASDLKMGSLALTIATEKDFSASPRSAKSCHFCELTKVCVKSTVAHE